MNSTSIGYICITAVLITLITLMFFPHESPKLTDPLAQRIYACDKMSNMSNETACLKIIKKTP